MMASDIPIETLCSVCGVCAWAAEASNIAPMATDRILKADIHVPPEFPLHEPPPAGWQESRAHVVAHDIPRGTYSGWTSYERRWGASSRQCDCRRSSPRDGLPRSP